MTFAEVAPEPPRIAAIVLAAGCSTRMSGMNKLLCAVDGISMVARVVVAACSSRCDQVLVVTGFEGEKIAAAVADKAVSIVHNPDYRAGLSTSLRCGLKALPANVDGAMILLGDMPLISAADIDRLLAAFAASSQRIVVPSSKGQRGNPVLWPRRHFADLASLQGDNGGRLLLERLAAETVFVPFDDDATVLDVDTRAALLEVNSR